MLENIVAITNRKLCKGEFLEQIEYLCKNNISKIILREKDLPEESYMILAEDVINIVSNYGTILVLHTYISVAKRLNHKAIHLTMNSFRKNHEIVKNYNIKGVSIHTVEEAIEAQMLGATYITASHVFQTDCKKGLEPKGLDYLRKVCKSVSIPVYGLGGINFNNMKEVLECGANKVCMMSELMNFSI